MPGTGRGGQLTAVEVRPLRPDGDLEAEVDLHRRSFGPVEPARRAGLVAGAQRSIEAGEMLGAFDGTRLVGSARYHPMRQWWHGKSMAMAGVAGVKVAPEYRGRGVGRALMNGLIPQMAAQGYPVSALYPATAPLYRSLGWETAGGRYETTVPAASLGRLLAPDGAAAGLAGGSPDDLAGLRRVSAADAAVVAETLGQVYGTLRDRGPATYDPGFLAQWLDDEEHFAYLCGDGFLSYRWADGRASIRVDVLAAASPSTARAFWQLLGSHASMAGTVRACLAPDDPVSWLTREPAAAVRQTWTWMLRLIDVPAAVAARGFPACVEVSVLLEIADDVLAANAGRWRLEVGDGAGKIARTDPLGPARGGPDGGGPDGGRPSGRGPSGRGPSGRGPVGGGPDGGGPVLRLGARGMAALYAGVPLATLRRAGLARGGDQTVDDALDSAFGGRPAFMVHDF